MKSREKIWVKWDELDKKGRCVECLKKLLELVNDARIKCGDEEVEKILRYILEE